MSKIKAEIDQINRNEILLGEPYDLSVKPSDPVKLVFFIPYLYEFSIFCTGPLALYDFINRSNDIPGIAERVVFYKSLYDDLGRLQAQLGDEEILTIESKSLVRNADILGISITNPGDLPTFFKIMDLAKIPYRSEHRVFGKHPIILGGNAGFANPEVMGNYVDVVALGDAELSIAQLVQITHQMLRDQATRDSFLRKIAKIPGMYVPDMYQGCLDTKGNIVRIDPKYPDIPSKVVPQYLGPQELHDAHFVSPLTDGRSVVIIPNLGCRWSCHFCSLGTPPYRQAPVELLTRFIDRIEQLEIERIVINSPTFTQYSHRYTLMNKIKDCKDKTGKKITTIIGSVRADELTDRYLQSVATLGDFGNLYPELMLNNSKGFIALAPEFASPDLVKHFNKTMTKLQLLNAIKLCKGNGHFLNIMLYFILGVPGETKTDRLGIADYAMEVFNTLQSVECSVIIKLQQFMPTVNTVSQRLEMLDPDLTEGYIDEIRDRLRNLAGDKIYKRHFRVIWGETKRLLFESICARGDRRIGYVLEYLHSNDIDPLSISRSKLSEVLALFRLEYKQYLRRREISEVVPWEIVNCVAQQQEIALIKELDQRSMLDDKV